MPKYRIKGERTLVEAWTYIVEADDEEQAIEMVEDCPDGYCDGIERLDDDQCYEDNTEFEVLEEIEEPKPKKKSNPKQMDGKKSEEPFKKTRKKKK